MAPLVPGAPPGGRAGARARPRRRRRLAPAWAPRSAGTGVAVALLGDRRTPASVRLLRAQEAERVPQTGAVASVQEAELTLAPGLLERIWTPENLERLARAYWRHLRRATFGLVRVVYGEDSRSVVLLSRRLVLLRFRAPEYEVGADRAERHLADRPRRAGRARGPRPRLPEDRRRASARRTSTRTATGACWCGSRSATSIRGCAAADASPGSGPGSTARPSSASTGWSATRSCARSAGGSLRRTQHRGDRAQQDLEPPVSPGPAPGRCRGCESWSPARRASWADC